VTTAVPIIDVAPLVAGRDARVVASEIDDACRATGFFVIVGHGVDHDLRHRLVELGREFFSRPEREKADIAMARGGRAWRGWFPLGAELTSGVPDRKEGIYFGAELSADDTRVRAGIPLHGPNLFPAHPPGLRDAVLEYMTAMTALGHTVLRGVAQGLGLDAQWFAENLTADPTVLFRIFDYPPTGDDGWGVAEHTDYGLLTMLMQDGAGGLQVRGPHGWTDVPADPDAFVCNIGDMLERMTAGAYRSTPHRVRNTTTRHRLSFPFFFDPGWDAEVQPIPGLEPPASAEAGARWDAANLHELSGPYGAYLLAKVARVFPELGSDVL
jgi:isopenicillin N synthase-like dioxygenase